MKIYFNFLLLTILILTFVLGSCGSSNDVVSNRFIQKRKYTKGWNINNSKKSKKKRSSSKDDLGKMSNHIELIDSDKDYFQINYVEALQIQNENNESPIDSETEIIKSKPIHLDSKVASTNYIESEKISEPEETDLDGSEGDKISVLFPSFTIGPILIYVLAGFALVLAIAYNCTTFIDLFALDLARCGSRFNFRNNIGGMGYSLGSNR